MSLLERIFEIQREVSPRSVAAFEKTIGKSNGYMNTISKQSGVPGTDVILSILDKYPQYSTDWILLGHGPKLKKEVVIDGVNEEGAAYGKNPAVKEIEDWMRRIIKEETDDKFKNINDSMLRLLRRSMDKNEQKGSAGNSKQSS